MHRELRTQELEKGRIEWNPDRRWQRQFAVTRVVEPTVLRGILFRRVQNLFGANRVQTRVDTPKDRSSMASTSRAGSSRRHRRPRSPYSETQNRKFGEPG